jgi:hypothetical protein
MAYVVTGEGFGTPKFYNVEQAVGVNAPNASGDVKLVQYLIKNLYGVVANGLAVDGWIGPKTVSWIEKFQKDAKASGANVTVDKRVDRALGATASVSQTTYTILLLNAALLSKNPGALAALPQHVPLSTKPKASPYQGKKVDYVVVMKSPSPHVVLVRYKDGSEETMTVSGQLVFPPGTQVVKAPLVLPSSGA